jgi:hypothetical protein
VAESLLPLFAQSAVLVALLPIFAHGEILAYLPVLFPSTFWHNILQQRKMSIAYMHFILSKVEESPNCTRQAVHYVSASGHYVSCLRKTLIWIIKKGYRVL